MTEKFKIKKIILWNIGIFIGVTILEILWMGNEPQEYGGMNFLFLLLLNFGFQVFINFILSVYSAITGNNHLAGAFLLTLIVVPLLEILIIFLAGFGIKFL